MNQFIIRQIIGEGASSTVYRAFDSLNKRNVAIKVFSRPSSDHEELNILGSISGLQSEHIVKFYECVSPSTYIFELCDSNLISFINDHELDIKGIKKIMRMILVGLCEIHRAGVIHRDLKLGNILIKDDCIKLCDFGLSCFIAQNDHGYCGTRDYLAPEMEAAKNGGAYSEKIDVYAAGIVYKTLIGRRKGGDVASLQVGEDVKKVILGMTEPRPDRRLSAMEALRDRSFDDLFSAIPPFEILKGLSKTTKYGRISRIVEGRLSCIQIEYSLDGISQVLRIEHSHQGGAGAERGRYTIRVNGTPVERCFLTNSMLKHFNYLCSYFWIVCERTVKYRDTEGIFTFTVTASGAEHLDWNNNKVTKRDGEYELSQGGTAVKRKTLPSHIEGIFNRFELKYREMSTFSVEQQTSMKISLGTENLIKRYAFIEQYGWAVKSGLTFIFLLNSGRRFVVDADERVVCDSGGTKMGICEMPVDLLQLIRAFLLEFL